MPEDWLEVDASDDAAPRRSRPARRLRHGLCNRAGALAMSPRPPPILHGAAGERIHRCRDRAGVVDGRLGHVHHLHRRFAQRPSPTRGQRIVVGIGCGRGRRPGCCRLNCWSMMRIAVLTVSPRSCSFGNRRPGERPSHRAFASAPWHRRCRNNRALPGHAGTNLDRRQIEPSLLMIAFATVPESVLAD